MTTESGKRGTSNSAPQRLLRTARALAGASLGGLVAAIMDASYASRATGTLPATRWSLLAADAGLVAPFALAVGVGVGVAGSLLSDSPARSLRDVVSRFAGGDRAERAARSATVIAVAITGLVCVVGLSHAARRAFASADPRTAGIELSGLTVLVMFAMSAAVSAARRSATRLPAALVDAPPRAALFAILSVLALAAVGLLSGTANGDGGFLGILAVLTREELDLRAVALLALIATCATLAPSILPARSSFGAAVAALLPLGLTSLAATSLDAQGLALTIERGAPLASPALRVVRRLTDRDHDGASARFGGGDCNDHDANVFPGAEDIPENGIDEDCSGSDAARLAPVVMPERGTESANGASWVKDHFPDGLSVVLVTIDTLRADLGFAGNPRPLSPHIDGLAKDSAVFDHAYSLASYTGKSMGPLLLGKYPSETSRNFDHFDTFGAEETFVQERIRKAGVRTLTAQAHWYFEPKTGLGRGFDVSDYSAEPKVPQMEGDRTVNGDILTDRAIALLRNPENVRGRFYLWLHYVDPHAAYVPHREFDFGSKSRDLYDGEVAFVDAQVGRLLTAIADAGLSARTAVILTSDHGEAFGEHGILRHGHEVWEELVHVPLIVHVPGATPRHVQARRSAIDVVPTLIELVSAASPSGQGPDFVSGQSLLPDVVGPSDGPGAERPVLVDMPEGPYNDERQAFFDGQYKLIATNGRPLGLYDLSADPGEAHDLLALGRTATPPGVARTPGVLDDVRGTPGVMDDVLERFKAYRRTLRRLPPRR